MTLDPEDIGRGQEQYEEYRNAEGRNVVQYDYRHSETGELFSVVDPSLKGARERRNIWLAEKGDLDLETFFDPHDPDHMAAYRHLVEKGSWPEGFLPEDLASMDGEMVSLMGVMAKAWMSHMNTVIDTRMLAQKLLAQVVDAGQEHDGLNCAARELAKDILGEEKTEQFLAQYDHGK